MAFLYRYEYTLDDSSLLFGEWVFDPNPPLLQDSYRAVDTYTVGSQVYEKFGALSADETTCLIPPR